MTNSAAVIRTPGPWYTATLGGMASYIDGATIVTTGISLVLFQQQLHLGVWAVGALSAALTFSFATGAIIGGRLGDLLGRRTVYSVDLVVYAAGVLAVIISPNLAVLFAGIVVTGLAMGADVPTSLALVAEEAPKGKQGRMVAYSQTLWLSGVAITQVLSLIVGGFGGLGARLMFVHLLVVAVVVWIMRRGVLESLEWKKTVSNPRARDRRRVRALFKKPYGIALLATALFFIIGGVLPNTMGQFGPYLMVHAAHSTVQAYSVVGLVGLAVSIVAALLYQRFVDTSGRKWWLLAGVIMLPVAPLLPALFHFSLWSTIALFSLNSIAGTFAGEGMYKVWTQEIFPTAIRSTAQGLTYGVARYCFAFIGMVTPMLLSASADVLMYVLVGAGLVAGLIALLWMPRQPRHGLVEDEPTESGTLFVTTASPVPVAEQ